MAKSPRQNRTTPPPPGEASSAPFPVLPPIPLPSLISALGPALIGAIILETLFRRMTRFPESVYEHPVILLGAIRHWPTWFSALAIVVIAIALSPWARTGRRIFARTWSDYQIAPLIRWLTVGVCAPLTWHLTTYDFSAYFGQWHLWDRLALAVCYLVVLFRPLALIPYLIIAMTLLFQFHHPLQGASQAMTALPLHAAFFSTGFFLWNRIRRHSPVPPETFFYGMLLTIGMHYWPSGWPKLATGWLLYDQIHYLLPSTYAAGWLSSWPATSTESLTRFLAVVDAPLRLSAVLIEVAGLAILCLPRRGVMLALAAWISLHLGIVLLSGIFFWQWIFVEAACLIAVTQMRSMPRVSGSGRVLAALTVATSHLWYPAPTLFWFDAKASYSYQIIGIDSQGHRQVLTPHFFSPHNYELHLQQLDCLVEDQPLLGITFGATGYPTSQKLAAVRTNEDLLELEASLGSEPFEPNLTKRLEHYFRRVLSNPKNVQQKLQQRPWWAAPEAILVSPPPKTNGWQPPIERVEVVQRLTFFDGNQIQEARRATVANIPITVSADVAEN